MAWEPAEQVQKNDQGQFRAMIGGQWIPVTSAQKSDTGEFRVEREPATPDQGILKNIGMGALKGASDIGATLMRPVDAALNTTGLTEKTNVQRRADLKGYFAQNANPESWSFKGGELGAGIAGTAGAGGVLAKGATALGAAPKLAAALSSGGFTLGGAPATTGGGVLANAGTRIGAGALTGGVQAGMINPADAGMGALIGGALPVAAATAGELGKGAKAALYDPIVNPQKILSSALKRAVGGQNAGQVAADISARQAATPGVRFSAGEASGNAALNAIEDSFRAGNAGGSLNAQAQTNRTKLADALRGIAQDHAAK